MNLRNTIYIILVACVTLSCQESPYRVDDARIVASVGDRVLQVSEISAALPLGVSGRDSVDFVDLYVERWVTRQIKVREAERIFSSSVGQIESMVESYRQALLTRKLDQYYIDSSKEQPFTSEQVSRYYLANSNAFKLKRAIVKGFIFEMLTDYEDAKMMQDLLKKSGEESRLNLISLSEKSSACHFVEFANGWIEYEDFIERLPIVKGAASNKYLKRDGLQMVQDATHTYYFEITAYRSAGYVSPLEVVEADIRRILSSQHQMDVVRSQEERLIKRAELENLVHRYSYDKPTTEDDDDSRWRLFPALNEN